MRQAPIPRELRERSASPVQRPVLALSDYPESDGEPMAETPVHWHATVDAAQPLMDFFRHREDAYIGSDMMMYYREGDVRSSVAPDVFVVFGVPKLPERRVWLTWVEGAKGPDFVLEVTSRKTRRDDEVRKHKLYAKLGVREYWQFDPTGDYLDPILKGHRLGPDLCYERIVLHPRDGALGAPSLLGLELRLDGQRLRYFDPAQRAYLPTKTEEAEMRRAAEAARDREASARRAAEARLAELERQLRDPPDSMT